MGWSKALTDEELRQMYEYHGIKLNNTNNIANENIVNFSKVSDFYCSDMEQNYLKYITIHSAQEVKHELINIFNSNSIICDFDL